MRDSDSVQQRLAALPSLADSPLDEEWMQRRAGLAAPQGSERPGTEPPEPGSERREVDPRRFYVPDPTSIPPTDRPVRDPSPPRPIEPKPRRRRRRTRRRVITIALVALVLLVVAEMVFLVVRYRGIERVALGDALGNSATGTNYLLVGTDSREGVDPDNPNAGVIFGDGVSGERTDTMVVLHVGDDGSNLMMAVPRDLLVTIAGSGEQQRINAAHQRGPDVLVRTITESLGIPIDHYFEVDFAGFLGVVDAIGGVEVNFAYPAIDTASGLFVPEAGPRRLDSHQALAYVRSRHYTELIDGQPVTDPTADLGRVARQQDFLRTLFRDIGQTRNPLELNGIVSSVSGNVRIDDRIGLFDLIGLARDLGGLEPETVVLPVQNGRTDAGASVLFLIADQAQPMLDRLR